MINLSRKGLGGSINRGTGKAIMSADEGSKLKKRYKADELRAKLAEIKLGLSAGKTELEICESMGLTTHQYNALRKELMRQETAALYAQSTEEVYLDYVWKQRKCVADLDIMVGTFHETKQYNALVGAVRAKSDIMDKIVKVGQEMGVLARAPESKMILHGVAIADMDNTDLRRMIAKEMEGLAAVVAKYGDKDMLGRALTSGDHVIELPNSPEFSDKGAPKMSKSGLGKVGAAKMSRKVSRIKAVDLEPSSG